jgi:glycosyltransferase involved in cell wall biosynthesis
VEETDAVISVSKCTKHQFEEVYGYDGPVEVVRYHNLPFFDAPVPLPDGPPWQVGYMGRLNIEQKNLDQLLRAIARLREDGVDTKLNLYGYGPDRGVLEEIRDDLGLTDFVTFYGRYDHRNDLHDIMAQNHVFTYTSNYEGGPCFTLLELLQAGRYVVAAPVGGIPDIYEGHPEAGRLVNPDDPGDIANVIERALEGIQNGSIDPDTVRRRYFDEFDLGAAHDAWCRTLGVGTGAVA